MAQAFEKVSPSIAYVETAISTGSGVLIDGGYVITNAHVVWPYQSSRIVFPDGTEFLDVPVKGVDTLSDLAILGPIDALVDEVELASGESLAIGTELYLIGYPGEVETFPQPTISRGVLARLREWDSAGLTYFQTDATIAGGQSGGALVSDKGEVIGISGFTFGEAGFGLAVSSEDIRPIIGHVIAGRNPPELVNRQVPSGRGSRRHVAETRNWWGQQAYVFQAAVGTTVDLEVTGESNVGFDIYDSLGEDLLSIGGDYSTNVSQRFATEYDEPHFLVAWQYSEDPSELEVNSSHSLTAFADLDDGRRLRLNQLIYGNIDFPGDNDYYLLTLRRGQIVEVAARSALSDTFTLIDFYGAYDDQIVVDDDSGGGLFGTDSSIIYEAPHSGDFRIVIYDAEYRAPGGYTIEVRVAPANSELTLTTRDSLFEGGSVSSSGFGISHLRAAFVGLPDSFEEFDPLDLGVSISELGLEEYGLDFLSEIVSFGNAEPFQWFMALSGELSNFDRELLATLTESPGESLGFFQEGLILESGEEFRLEDSGILSLPTIGDASFGAWAKGFFEDVYLRMDMVIFKRGSIGGLVYNYFAPGTTPQVSTLELAKMLELAITEYLVAR